MSMNCDYKLSAVAEALPVAINPTDNHDSFHLLEHEYDPMATAIHLLGFPTSTMASNRGNYYVINRSCWLLQCMLS